MIHWEPVDNVASNDMDKTIDPDAKTAYTTDEDEDEDVADEETVSALTDPKFDLDDDDDAPRNRLGPLDEAPFASSCDAAHHLRSAADILRETLSDAVTLLAIDVDSSVYGSMKHRIAGVAEAVRSSACRVRSSVESSVGGTLRRGREGREERERRRREEEMWRLERRRARYMAEARDECLGVANMWRDK